jgi:hypothetical protein
LVFQQPLSKRRRYKILYVLLVSVIQLHRIVLDRTIVTTHGDLYLPDVPRFEVSCPKLPAFSICLASTYFHEHFFSNNSFLKVRDNWNILQHFTFMQGGQRYGIESNGKPTTGKTEI